MPTYTTRYPPAHDSIHVKASSLYDNNYHPYYATDPAKQTYGVYSTGNAWFSAAGSMLPQKFGVWLGAAYPISRIILYNGHSVGQYTASGLKTFRVYGSNAAAALTNIANTADLTDLTLLGEYTARQHVASDVADPQTFDINGGSYAYVVLVPVDSWGVYNYIGFRRIEIQSADAPVYASVITELTAPYRAMATTQVIAELAAPYRHASRIITELGAPYRSAWQVVSELEAPCQATIPIIAEMLAPYRGVVSVIAELAATYRAVEMASVIAELAAPYRATTHQSIIAELAAPYRSEGDLPALEEYRCTIAGQVIDPVRISATISRQQSAIEAEIEVADEWAYRLATRHAPATIDLWGYYLVLVVDGRSRRESFGEHTYTIRLASPSVQLEFPWAAKREGELTGLASAIAQDLAGSIPVHWQTVDWYIHAGVWIAAGESPLALLQALVSAARATLISRLDGGLDVLPLYPVPVPDWPTALPARQVATAGEVYSLETSDEHRDGINRLVVSDQAEASDTLRIEEDTERRRGGITEVLVYQTPWRDDFSLTHRGDAVTAGITPMGIEERVVADEEIIVQDGKANTAYPVYAVLGARYNRLNLGTPTYSKDGRVTTAIAGDSILILSYRTRARRYQVRESSLADLLVVAATGEVTP